MSKPYSIEAQAPTPTVTPTPTPTLCADVEDSDTTTIPGVPTPINTEPFEQPIPVRESPTPTPGDVCPSGEDDKLPENVRNELLLKVADSKYAAEYVAATIYGNFDKLQKDGNQNMKS